MSGYFKIVVIYLKYCQCLMCVVVNIVDDNDVEDIVQDVFVKSYEVELNQEIQYEWIYMLRMVCNFVFNYVFWVVYKLNDQVDNMDLLLYSNMDVFLEKQFESKQWFIYFCQVMESLLVEVKCVFLLKKVYDMSQCDIVELL